MRPQAITVENPVIKTTTVREVVPSAAAAGAEFKTPRPDYWEFVRAIDEKQIGTYMIYLYREEPGKIQIDHTTGIQWETPHGLVWIGDPEALEAVVARDCGGGTFRVVIKRRQNSEWIAEAKFRIDLPPRPITPWYFRRPVPGQEHVTNTGTNGNRTVLPGDPTAQIATKAMEMVAGQEHQAMNIGIDLFRAAGEVLKHPQQNALTDELMRSILARAINPPPPPPAPDPIELLTRVMALQAQLNPGSSGGNPLMSKIVDVALTRLLEPINAAPAVSVGAEMMRAVPGIIGQVGEIAREWRMKAEAERDTVAMMQHAPPPQRAPVTVPLPQPQALPAPVARAPVASANPAIAGGPVMVPPSTEFVENRIMQILSAATSADEAAERTLEFLYTLTGEDAKPEEDLVETLVKYGEEGLMQFFASRPVLRPATANPAKLREFIRSFLRQYQEEKREDEMLAAAKPN